MVLIKNETVGRPGNEAEIHVHSALWFLGSDSDTNLNFLLTLSHWVMTNVFGQNIGKKFSDLKFVSDRDASSPLTVRVRKHSA